MKVFRQLKQIIAEITTNDFVALSQGVYPSWNTNDNRERFRDLI